MHGSASLSELDFIGVPTSELPGANEPVAVQPAETNDSLHSEVVATFCREKYRKGDFVIATVEQTTELNGKKTVREFSALGYIGENYLKPGLDYKFVGKLEDSKYGKQIKFDHRTPTLITPAGRSAVIKYLSQCKDIGARTAEQIWNRYGEDSVQTLREHPEQVADNVHNVSLKVLTAASEFLKGIEKDETVRLDLMNLFEGQKIPKSVVDKLIRKFGDKAAQRIRQNPFRLLDERGIGFDKANAVYCSLGLPKGKACRQGYCIYYLIYDDRNGHTWFTESKLRDHLEKKISGDVADFDKAIEFCLRMKLLVARRNCEVFKGVKKLIAEPTKYMFGEYVPDPNGYEFDCYACEGTGGKANYALTENAKHEQRIARRIAQAQNEKPQWPIVEPAEEGKRGATQHQSDELRKSLAGMISIFAGAPGTGKTFTLAELIKLVIKANASGSVAICAPTGKAAVRCTELMSKNGVNITATTIHRLLQPAVDEKGRKYFAFNAQNPLPFRFVVVDETSMIASPLMADLLDACGSGTHVLFIGDTNQLPPIDHGAPLRDLISAGLPYGELREIHRNAGSIVRACAAIRDGLEFETDREIDLESEPPKNLKLINAAPNDLTTKILAAVRSIRDEAKFNAIWDVQVIVALNQASTAAREPLNKALQELLNPAGLSHKNWEVRINDKVIQTANGWMTEHVIDLKRLEPPKEFYVANGEIGQATGFDQKNRAAIQFDSPSRHVVASRGDDGGVIELAYAVTGHKMQGSQSKITIVALDPSAGAVFGVCSREWLFTALSRAETYCLLVGEMATARKYCKRVVLPLRKTMLAELIHQFKGEEVGKRPVSCMQAVRNEFKEW